ncbi:ABC transporter permease [Pelagibius sp. Alg239-R121]|uniref:ABC transporter permease n=1 Tax=Pelagibius sp. Alg239-R121 TaxID=2993448 RepID=UPI0024A664B9|nr:ABC transporter permease [Pelagibius sp. Alg239-R121]
MRLNNYWLLVAPLLLLVMALYAWPVINILWLSVTEPQAGLQNYEKLFASSSLARILWTTLRVCLLTTFGAVLAGYLVAYMMAHLASGERSWMLTFVLVSFWVSVLVRAFAWLTLLGRNGLLNGALISSGLTDEPITFVRNELGVLIGMIHYMIPYAVLPLLANMQGLDGRVMSASRSLGAGPLVTFRRIYLPLTMPGIFAASILVFVISLGFYVTPAILGGGRVLMAAEYISVQVLVTLQWGTASMLATLMLGGVLALMFTLSRFMKLSEVFGAKA